ERVARNVLGSALTMPKFQSRRCDISTNKPARQDIKPWWYRVTFAMEQAMNTLRNTLDMAPCRLQAQCLVEGKFRNFPERKIRPKHMSFSERFQCPPRRSRTWTAMGLKPFMI